MGYIVSFIIGALGMTFFLCVFIVGSGKLVNTSYTEIPKAPEEFYKKSFIDIRNNRLKKRSHNRCLKNKK